MFLLISELSTCKFSGFWALPQIWKDKISGDGSKRQLNTFLWWNLSIKHTLISGDSETWLGERGGEKATAEEVLVLIQNLRYHYSNLLELSQQKRMSNSNNNNLSSYSPERARIQHQGVSRFSFSLGCSSWLAKGCLLPVSSHDVFLCVQASPMSF